MDTSRKQATRDRGSRAVSHSPKRTSMEVESARDSEGSLLLANPMACEVDSPTSPRQTVAFPDKPTASTKSVKSRPKSPSFIRMLVGSFRSKQSSADEKDDTQSPLSPPSTAAVPRPLVTVEYTSVSDNEEMPNDKMSSRDRHSEINHIATLPRRPERKKKKNKLKKEEASPDMGGVSRADPVYETVGEEKQETIEHVDEAMVDGINITSDEYHSVGLDALETLHDQLQILVRQESEHLIADSLQDKVVASLRQQLEDLHHSLDCLQKSDKNLRLALKMGETRFKEAELKLQLTTDRCQRMEQRNRRLDHKYRLLLRQHRELEKHLQKKAVINQMIDQQSPNRLRRPHSARDYQRRSSHEYVPRSTTVAALTSPVKRHSSTDGLHSLPITTGPLPLQSSSAYSGSTSLSHTETRV